MVNNQVSSGTLIAIDLEVEEEFCLKSSSDNKYMPEK